MPVPTSAQAANLRATLKTEGVKLAARGVDIPPEMLANLAQATKESGLTRAVTRGSVGRTDITALTKQISIMSANLSRADKDTVALASALRANKAYEGIRSVIRASGANVPETLNKYMRSMQGRLGVLTGGKDATELLSKIVQSSEATRKDMDRISRPQVGGGINPFFFTSMGGRALGSKTLGMAPKIHRLFSGMARMGMGAMGAEEGGMAMGAAGLAAGAASALAVLAGLAIESPGIGLNISQGLLGRYSRKIQYLTSGAQAARYGGMSAGTNVGAGGIGPLGNKSLGMQVLRAIAPQFSQPDQFWQTVNASRTPFTNQQQMLKYVSAVGQAQLSGPGGLGGLSAGQYGSAFTTLFNYGIANRNGGNRLAPQSLSAFNNVFGRVMERSVQMGMDKSAAVEAIQSGIKLMSSGGGMMFSSMPGTIMNKFLANSGTFQALRNPQQAISAMSAISGATENAPSNPTLFYGGMQFLNKLPGKTMREKIAHLKGGKAFLKSQAPGTSDNLLGLAAISSGLLNPYAPQIVQNLTRGLPPGLGAFAMQGLFPGMKYGAANTLVSSKTPLTGGSAGSGAAVHPGIAMARRLMVENSKAPKIVNRLMNLLKTDPAKAKAFLNQIQSSTDPKDQAAAVFIQDMVAQGLIAPPSLWFKTKNVTNGGWGSPTIAMTTATAFETAARHEIATVSSFAPTAANLKNNRVLSLTAELLEANNFNSAQARGIENPSAVQAVASQQAQLEEAQITSSGNWIQATMGFERAVSQFNTAVQNWIHRIAPNGPNTR